MPILRNLKCCICKAKSSQGDVIYGKPAAYNPTEEQKKCNHIWLNDDSFFYGWLFLFKFLAAKCLSVGFFLEILVMIDNDTQYN